MLPRDSRIVGGASYQSKRSVMRHIVGATATPSTHPRQHVYCNRVGVESCRIRALRAQSRQGMPLRTLVGEYTLTLVVPIRDIDTGIDPIGFNIIGDNTGRPERPGERQLRQNFFHNAPCLHFNFRSHRGIVGTSRWQAREDVAVFAQGRRCVTAKRPLRLAAVEEYMRDVRVSGEQARKVVGHLFCDRRVQTAGPSLLGVLVQRPPRGR